MSVSNLWKDIWNVRHNVSLWLSKMLVLLLHYYTYFVRFLEVSTTDHAGQLLPRYFWHSHKNTKTVRFQKAVWLRKAKAKIFWKIQIGLSRNHKFPKNVIVKPPMFFHFIKNVGHDFWSVIRIFGSLDVSVTPSIIHSSSFPTLGYRA